MPVGERGSSTMGERLTIAAVVAAIAAGVAVGIFTTLKIKDTAGDNTIQLAPTSDEAADRQIQIPALGGNRNMVVAPAMTANTLPKTTAADGTISDSGITDDGSDISTTERFLRGTATTADATADSIFSASAADKTPLVLQGAAGQTAPLQKFQKSDGTVWSYVDAVGGFYGGADFITTAVGSNYRCNAGSGVSWHASGSSGAVDLGLARASAGVVKVTDGGTSDALRIGASGRIYGNAVAAIGANAGNKRSVTTNVATMTTYTAHNLCAGQTITIASCGDATYDGMYITASVPSTTTFTFALTHADEAETIDAAVTMTPVAQIQLGDAPSGSLGVFGSGDKSVGVGIRSAMPTGISLSADAVVGYMYTAGVRTFYIDSNGFHVGNGYLDYNTAYVDTATQLSSTGVVNWSGNVGSKYGTADTGLARAEAGIVKVTDGSTGLGAITASKVETSTVNTSALATMSISEELTCATGAVTFTTTADLLPANSFIIGVSARVTQAPADAVTWGMGVSGTLEKFAENLQPKTLGQMTSSWATGHAAGTGGPTTMLAPFVQAAAAKVVVTFSGDPGATSAKIRITVFYQTLTPPGS